jgi:hypothetical protein
MSVTISSISASIDATVAVTSGAGSKTTPCFRALAVTQPLPTLRQSTYAIIARFMYAVADMPGAR